MDKLRLLLAFLATALCITVCLLLFGTSADTFRLLLSGILISITSVLLIYIFRHQLFGSLEKPLLQKDELDQIAKAVDAEIERISKKQDTAKGELMKQLKKQEKEIASLKKIVEQIEDHMHLTHSNY